jgi:competence protein ComEA
VVQVLSGRVEGAAPAQSGGGWVPARPGSDPEGEAVGLVDLTDGRKEAGDLDAELRRARRPALLSIPSSLRAGRISVSSSAVVAVLALVVALACAFVLRILWAERSVDEGAHLSAPAALGTAPGARVTPQVVSRSGAAPGGFASSGPTGAPTEVVVHVVGQVGKPGLVRLRVGARVADALEAAGGATRRADVAALNLARVVVDGEQILVPKPGESPPPAGAVGSGASGGAAGAGGGGGGAGGLVNLNTADLAALDSLPGVGPVLAQRILDWRTEHGRFTSVEELGEVSGIGDKMLSQLRPKVTV